MGLILDTNDTVLGLEERRESFIVLDLERKYSHPPSVDEFKIERRLKGDQYEFTLVKKSGERWLDCEGNMYKAEITRDALNALMASRAPRQRLSEHIFANADGEIEVSKEYLRKLVEFFDDPENRKRLGE